MEEFKKYWKNDLLSGLIVFMIALPLSVGIALASGAPATAGIFAAIVGGILGSVITGSYVTINGPAAGLIVIILSSVQVLGKGDLQAGFKYTLAATVVAGVIQILMGIGKLGTLGLSFPSAVIHGMLTAIGAIIMAKQVHVALGVKPAADTIFGLIGEIPTSIMKANPDIVIISAVGAVIMLFFSFVKWAPLKRIPAPLIVVLLGIALAAWLDLDHEHTVGFLSKKYTIGPNFLLNIPDHLAAAFTPPDFSIAFTSDFIRMAIAIALVASLESVLSTFAVDKLDPQRRTSNLNRDLWAKGLCNVVLGFIGGLPVISEIVRSSANVSNGAKTRWSNFFHGVLMLLFVMLFPHLLHEIPMASLAVILIFVGFRLAHPAQFIHAKEIGWDHLFVFVLTFITTLMTDLLVGVGVGVLGELVLNLLKHVRLSDTFRIKVESSNKSGECVIRVNSSAVFTNYIFLKKIIDNNLNRDIILDFSRADVVDHTVLEHLHHYKKDMKERGKKFDMKFSSSHRSMSEHPLSAKMLKIRAS